MQCECLGLAPLWREVGRSLEEELALGPCWVERWSGKWQRSAWVGQWVGQCLFLKELKGTYSLLLKNDCPTHCPTRCNSIWARRWQSEGRPGPRRSKCSVTTNNNKPSSLAPKKQATILEPLMVKFVWVGALGGGKLFWAGPWGCEQASHQESWNETLHLEDWRYSLEAYFLNVPFGKYQIYPPME